MDRHQVVMRNLFFEDCDEEIAYQMQLEALAGCSSSSSLQQEHSFAVRDRVVQVDSGGLHSNAGEGASSSRGHGQAAGSANWHSDACNIPRQGTLSSRGHGQATGPGSWHSNARQASSSRHGHGQAAASTSRGNSGGLQYAGGGSQVEADRLMALRIEEEENTLLELMHAYGTQAPDLVGGSAIVEIECKICLESHPHSSFFSAGKCDHLFCFECCTKHAESKVENGDSQLNCPEPSCSCNYDVEKCKLLLSPQSFNILMARQTEAAIPVSEKVYCPYRDCSALMEKSKSSNGWFKINPEGIFVECGTCHRAFCLQCNVPWHANQNCREFQEHQNHGSGDETVRKLAKKKKWRICDVCQHIIELKEGCYHITCVCGNEFCYTCGAKYKNKHATCRCKIWDERNIIRPGGRGRV